jgi:hypothetical protein
MLTKKYVHVSRARDARRFHKAVCSEDGGCQLFRNRRMSQWLTDYLGNADAPQLGVDRALRLTRHGDDSRRIAQFLQPADDIFPADSRQHQIDKNNIAPSRRLAAEEVFCIGMAYDLEAEMIQQQRKRIAHARIILKNMHRHAFVPDCCSAFEAQTKRLVRPAQTSANTALVTIRSSTVRCSTDPKHGKKQSLEPISAPLMSRAFP